uniref:Potassium channel domain-containing protein n=1 Tax=Setaria digitata TaxID=48799 RepID=A0A915PNV9_9BILA
MHFTSRICSIFGRTVYKTSIQQSNIDLGQVENGILIGAGKNNIENRNENYDNHSGKPKFEIGDEVIEDSIKDEEAMLNYDSTMLTNNTPPRIPVFLAIGITFSWIFLCAGLFKIWERDWTYAESCYFMFISLSTIGLGDLSVRRRDLMIMCFVFVIIGLAMVSMCINVIQRALEDFCVKVFLKLFLEYQSKLNQGNGAAGASVGMMQMWDNNKKAKYLMQFLSKNKRTSVLAKAQKDAEAHGIEIPPLFSDIDEESGMPKLLTKDADESMLTVALEEIHQVEEAKQNTPAISQIELSLPKTVFYDVDVQTCLLAFDDKAEQTTTVAVLDTAIVTDPLTNEMVEKATQCHELALVHSIAQTESVEMKDSECVTIIPEYITRNVQTEGVQVIEQEIQTHLFDVLEAVTQTEAFIYSAHCIQTSLAETTENEMQTDPVIHEELKGRSRISKVRKRLQEAFGQRRESTCRSVTGEDEFSEGDEENESSEDTSNLDWDPIDGMHAEKQRRVRDLKEFFETSRKRGSVRRRSQFRSSAPPSQADAINFKINN